MIRRMSHNTLALPTLHEERVLEDNKFKSDPVLVQRKKPAPTTTIQHHHHGVASFPDGSFPAVVSSISHQIMASLMPPPPTTKKTVPSKQQQRHLLYLGQHNEQAMARFVASDSDEFHEFQKRLKKSGMITNQGTRQILNSLLKERVTEKYKSPWRVLSAQQQEQRQPHNSSRHQ